jgi:glutamate racemase
MYGQFRKLSIGLFDSGVGGLSVWKEALKILPGHRFLYFADTAYAPYGPRSEGEVVQRAIAISRFLISKGAGVIVVACNTATSAAISTLREVFDIPFIGMEPAVKPAASLTKTGVIGVLATKGTLGGRKYHLSLNKYASDIKVVEQVGEGLVGMVESGITSGKDIEKLVGKYLSPMMENKADYIVLGCTHYPFLKDVIEKVAGVGVTLIDPAPAVARHIYRRVREMDIISQESRTKILGVDLYRSCYADTTFYSSGDTKVLAELARNIVPEIPDSYFQSVDI